LLISYVNISQFGSKKTLGADVGKPTYVFPSTLKRVIREVIPGALVDKPDPTHARVSVIQSVILLKIYEEAEGLVDFPSKTTGGRCL